MPDFERLIEGFQRLEQRDFDMDAGALLAYSPRTDAFLPLVCPRCTEAA